MYVFRIIDMIDRSKSWYAGERFASAAYEDTVVTNPPSYPPSGSSGDAGDSVDRYGYIYTSLQDNNTSQPETNYAGYPVLDSANSWIRSGFSNKTKMTVPESGGITESYGAGMSGILKYPTGSIPNGMYNDVESCTCCLLCGVLGASITINGSTITGIDSNGVETGYGNPEITGLNSAFTVSNSLYTPFTWNIGVSGNTPSTYCAGCYLGSWSYVGITQWTDHKKSINDYSRQEQDDWGNYSLSKGRAGRTYSAEVVLTCREGATDADYDYSLIDLCFSVSQLLRSLLGKPAAFYFNNQDIGCLWIPHNTDRHEEVIKLTDSDIIVGVLQNFEITDMTGNRAILKMSVNSVPNEYQNYSLIGDDAPSTSPPVIGATPVTTLEYRTETTITLTDNVTDVDLLWHSPVNATMQVQEMTISDPTKCTIQGSSYDRGDGYFVYKVQITKVATSFSGVTLTVSFRYVDANYILQELSYSYTVEA